MIRPEVMRMGGDEIMDTNSLEMIKDFIHGEKTHRVFKDKEGRVYIEILLEVESQRFLSEFLSRLGILTCEIVKYKDKDGKIIYLSKYPKQQEYTYALAGKTIGTAQMLFIIGAFNCLDWWTDKNFEDSSADFTDKSYLHNMNIFLGNIVFYDFDLVKWRFKMFDENYMSEVQIPNLLNLSFGFLIRKFRRGGFKEFDNDFGKFKEIVCLDFFNELLRIKDLLKKDGEKIISELMKEQKIISFLDIFNIFDNSNTVKDLVNILIRRIDAMLIWVIQKGNFEVMATED